MAWRITAARARVIDLEEKLLTSNDRFTDVYDRNRALEAQVKDLADQVDMMRPTFETVQRMIEEREEWNKLRDSE